jgi:hypothetical protein
MALARGPAKRFVDIEYALRWAYRDELPKRHALPRRLGTHTQERVWSPYTRPADYPEVSPSFREATGGGPSGGYADGWSRDPGFPQALGEPHPDAITMEAAVKGLAAWAGHGFGPDPTAAGLMHGLEHMEVDHVQAGMEAVAAMAGIIAVHARAGTRPRWSRRLPEPLQITGPNGKPKVLIDETFVEKFDRKGMYYEPVSNPPPGAITFTKAVPSPAHPRGSVSAGRLLPAHVPALTCGRRRGAGRICGLAHGAGAFASEFRGGALFSRPAAAGGAMAAMGGGDRTARTAARVIPRAAR